MLLFWLVLFVELAYSATEEDKTTTSVMSGIIFEEAATTILYDSSYRLSFVQTLPRLPVFEQDDSCLAMNDLCKLYEQVQLVQRIILEDIGQSHPYMSSRDLNNRTNRGILDFVGGIDHELFGLATDREVGILHSDMKKLVEHALELEDAVKSNQNYSMSVASDLTSFTKKWDETVNTEMKKIKLQFQTSNTQSRRELTTLAKILRISNQNEFALHTMSRLDFIASDCRNRMIPRQILSDKVLLIKLALLSEKLNPAGFEVAVTVNSMLKLAIADCIFGKDQVLVTINIPIRKIYSNYKLYKVIAVPFQSRQDQCVIHSDVSAIITSNTTIISVDNNKQESCNVGAAKLCQVPIPMESRSRFSDCARSLFAGNEVGIKKDCILECHRSNATKITRLAGSKYVVTNAQHIQILCTDSTNTTLIPETSFGANQFHLGCNCVATVNHATTLRPTDNCRIQTIQMEMTNVIPTHFTKDSGVIFSNGPIVFQNATDVINEDWHMDLPIFNSTPTSPIVFHTKLDSIDTSLAQENKDASQMLWLFLMTVYTILLSIYVLVKLPPCVRPGPLSILLLCTVCVCAENPSIPSFEPGFWSFVRSIEYVTVSFVLLGLLFCFTLTFFQWKLYSYTKANYQLLKTLALNVDGSKQP